MKKYLVYYKWVSIAPNKVSLLNVGTGVYSMTLDQMLKNGGTVIWQGTVQVESANPLKVFALARFQATKSLNQALLGGSISQDNNKSTVFVMTNVKEIITKSSSSKLGMDGSLESLHINEFILGKK